MSLIGKCIKLKEFSGYEPEERHGLEYQVIDKINATHHNNAGDDEYLMVSLKTGTIQMILPTYLVGAKILPGSDQA